jgi:hypothetical protein
VSLRIHKPTTHKTHKRTSDSGTRCSKSGSDLKIRVSENVRVAEEIAVVVESARSRGGGKIEDVSSRGC